MSERRSLTSENPHSDSAAEVAPAAGAPAAGAPAAGAPAEPVPPRFALPPLASARTVAWLRLLLVLTATGAGALFVCNRTPGTLGQLPLLLMAGAGLVYALSFVFILTARMTQRRWQLALHLVFDVLWIGGLLWMTGGVSSPGVSLLFAVLLIGTQALPGVAPFMLPAVASLALAVIAALYLAGVHPLPLALIQVEPGWVAANPMLGSLALQVAALFLVDLLGQALAGRLREQRAFTTVLLDQLGEGVLAIDRQGVIAYANAGLSRLLGLARQPFIGLPVTAVLDAAALAEVRRWLVDEDWPRVERFTHNGLHLVLRFDRLQDLRGRLIGRIVVVADETRLRSLEDNAQRAERLTELGAVAAGIAHEIRNPLTSLRGCAQELAVISARSSNSDAAHLAEIMVGESDRLARIVEDALALTRVRDPLCIRIAARPVIEAVLMLARGRRDLPTGLMLSLSCAGDEPALLADVDQLKQVLINVINNAIDACRAVPVPRITVRLERSPATITITPRTKPAAMVRISVTDTGCGIAETLQERVFAPFFSTKAQGTGLGLSLVARLVRAHGGTIDLQSQPGSGTRIDIDWPAAPAIATE